MSTESPADPPMPEPGRVEPVEAPSAARQRVPERDFEDVVARAARTGGAGAADAPAVVQREEFEALSNAVLEAAEVASQAALAASLAGRELKATAGVLSEVSFGLGKRSIWGLGILTGLLVLSIGFFTVMAVRMISKTNRLDATLMAVGKRVVEMDASLELVGGAQEAIKTVLTKQSEMAAAQAKIDARLEEVIKSAQGVPEQTAKQVEARVQALSKQVSALDARFAAQSQATSKMASQVQAMQGALGDASAIKRDLEAMARQQRERQNSEAARAAQEAAAARARENMVQYPRKSGDKP